MLFRSGRNLVEAFQKAVQRLEGFFAFAVLSKEEPNKLLVFKRSNPLVIGLGHGENFVASDVPALLPYTNRVLYLEDDEYAVLSPEKVEVFSLKTASLVKRHPTEIRWSVSQAQKGGYPHFMLKEIFEQPRILEETAAKRLDQKGHIFFDTLNKKLDRRLKKIEIGRASCRERV